MRFPWKKSKKQGRIRATRDQAQKLAVEAEERGRNATRRFRYSTLIFIAGLVPLSVLGVYGAFMNVHGSVSNTVAFIGLSFLVAAAFMFYLTRDLEERFKGLTGTIKKKGLKKRF